MKKILLCITFLFSTVHGSTFHDLQNAINENSPERVIHLLQVANLSQGERQVLLDYAHKAVDERRSAIESRDKRVLIGNLLKFLSPVAGLGLVGYFLDPRLLGVGLGLGVAIGGAVGTVFAGTVGGELPAFAAGTATVAGVVGCGYLEAYLWRRAREEKQALASNYEKSVQMRNLMLVYMQNNINKIDVENHNDSNEN